MAKEMKERQVAWRKEKLEEYVALGGEEKGDPLVLTPQYNDQIQTLTSADEGDKPGWGNSPPKSFPPSERLGVGEKGGGGAYYKILRESNASYNAGPLTDLSEDVPGGGDREG